MSPSSRDSQSFTPRWIPQRFPVPPAKENQSVLTQVAALSPRCPRRARICWICPFPSIFHARKGKGLEGEPAPSHGAASSSSRSLHGWQRERFFQRMRNFGLDLGLLAQPATGRVIYSRCSHRCFPLPHPNSRLSLRRAAHPTFHPPGHGTRRPPHPPHLGLCPTRPGNESGTRRGKERGGLCPWEGLVPAGFWSPEKFSFPEGFSSPGGCCCHGGF